MLEKYKNHPFFIPFLWSAGAHLAAICFFLTLFLTYFPDGKKDALVSHVFHMKGVDTRPTKPGRKEAVKTDRLQATRQFINTQTPGEPVIHDVPFQTLVNKEPQWIEKKDDVDPKKVDFEGKASLSAREFETILNQTDQRQLSDKVQSKQRSTSKSSTNEKILSKEKRPDSNSLLQYLQKPLEGLHIYGNDNVNLDPEEGMPGFTPMSQGRGHGGDSDYELGGRIGEATKDLRKYEFLDEFMDIEVFTYQNPADKKNYYRLKIFAKKGAEALKVMPKEILFTIDCSLSISPDRLEEFKKGIRYCLQNLNPDDVFNIVAFRDKAVFFRNQSLPATPDLIRSAEKFIDGLTSNNRTDVYSVFSTIVKSPVVRRPSNVILISDGRPTHGVMDSRELLASITRINKGVRPVFAFSGGSRVNRYLLDFLAYQNRAWSQYIKKTPNIDKGLAAFYDKIRDPIFLDLRYRLNNLNEKDVYPKALPDFYKNAEFTLYGTYENEDQFSMQFLGDLNGKTKELIFSRSLKEAKKGDADILKGWAFNKIYYLISRISTEGNSPTLLKEIDELSRRYGIKTPYSPEILKMD